MDMTKIFKIGDIISVYAWNSFVSLLEHVEYVGLVAEDSDEMIFEIRPGFILIVKSNFIVPVESGFYIFEEASFKFGKGVSPEVLISSEGSFGEIPASYDRLLKKLK